MVAGPGPVAKKPKNSSTCLNLGKINQWTLQVTNISRYFRTTGLFCSIFSPKPGPLGAKLYRHKKISAACFAKVTDITHFTSLSRSASPAYTPTLRHGGAVYVPHLREPAPAASGSLPNGDRVRQRERNFQQGRDNWPEDSFKAQSSRFKGKARLNMRQNLS